MRRKRETKDLAMAGALVLAFVLLAGALDQVSLAPGLRLESAERYDGVRETDFAERSGRDGARGSSVWVSLVVSLAVVLFFVGLVKREHRVATAALIPITLALVWLMSLLPSNPLPPPQALDEGETGGGEPAFTGELLTPDVDETATAEQRGAPGLLNWLIVIAGSVGVFAVVRPGIGRRRVPTEPDAASLESSVDQALREVESGADTLDVVIRAYRQMLEAYSAALRVNRPQTVTPRGLAARLVRSGVAEDDAWGLTLLFERTRYGSIRLSEREEESAVRYLRGISEALRS